MSYILIKLSKKKKAVRKPNMRWRSLTLSLPVAWSGRAVSWEPLERHLLVFLLLCSLGGVFHPLAEHGPPDNIMAVNGREHMKASPLTLHLQQIQCPDVFCSPSVVLRQRHSCFLLWKISKIDRSGENSAVNCHVPIIQVHKWPLRDYFPFISIPHPLPEAILQQILDISVLCFLETVLRYA